MRKIAAHFWLRPNGTVGKFPIVTFNDANKIIEIREREVFLEEAGLELVNGFLVPGLVDFAPNTLINYDGGDLKRYLNSQIIGGTKVLGVRADLRKIAEELSVRGLLIIENEAARNSTQQTAFEVLKSQQGGVDELIHFTRENAESLGVLSNYGTLEVGKTPGLLSIQKMNYENFCISSDSRIKVVI